METARHLSNPFMGGVGDKCFGCSKTNSHGLHLEFVEDGDDVVCRWKPEARFQSWDGVLHGGITTTIIDETAGWATMRRFQRSAMTTRIDIRFLKPARIDTPFFVSKAKYVCQVNEKIARFHATLEDADGLVCAEADADYYVMDEKRSKAMGFTSCEAKETGEVRQEMAEEQEKLIGREFRHFKGNLYRIEGFAKDSETLEEMVVYRALYGEHGLWVRPAKMFFETIERDGKRMKRFELMEENL